MKKKSQQIHAQRLHLFWYCVWQRAYIYWIAIGIKLICSNYSIDRSVPCRMNLIGHQPQFKWTGTVNQFSSFELELVISSFHLNWSWKPVQFIWTGVGDQFISFELALETSSFHLNWRWKPVQFIWTGVGNQFNSYELELKTQFFDSVHMNCWTWTVTHLVTTREIIHNHSLM
jgi:hypothetical protein